MKESPSELLLHSFAVDLDTLSSGTHSCLSAVSWIGSHRFSLLLASPSHSHCCKWNRHPLPRTAPELSPSPKFAKMRVCLRVHRHPARSCRSTLGSSPRRPNLSLTTRNEVWWGSTRYNRFSIPLRASSEPSIEFLQLAPWMLPQFCIHTPWWSLNLQLRSCERWEMSSHSSWCNPLPQWLCKLVQIEGVRIWNSFLFDLIFYFNGDSSPKILCR